MSENAPGQLRPCPFCGSNKATHTAVRDGRQVFCAVCHAAGGPAYHGPNHDTLPRAIAAWNMRQPDLQQVLADCYEYFDKRADADQPSGDAVPTPNEEMRLQLAIREFLNA